MSMPFPMKMTPYGVGQSRSAQQSSYSKGATATTPYATSMSVAAGSPYLYATHDPIHSIAGVKSGGGGTGTRPLRMVHVGPCFARGGAEQQIIDLARFLDPRRLQIEKCIVTMPHMVDPAVVADMPAPVEVGGEEEIRRAAGDCDVLMFWGMEMDEWLAEHRPKLCVYQAHGDSDWTHDLLKNSMRVTDHVIAVSRRVKDLVCNGFPTSVILNGVDSARLAQTRSRQDVRHSFGFAPDDFVLGYVGRFSPEKRPEMLVEAVARLPRHFKALFVGWGPLLGDLFQLANARIPGRFAFVTAHHHLGDYYRAMDALCLLSVQEGFALVALEAMMCERVLIATPVGSVPEMIEDRVNGIVVNDDVQSVCEAAERLHRHPHWARAIALEGKTYAEQHGHAWRMAREYENLLEKLWAEKHAA